jgi:hypothetical protein
MHVFMSSVHRSSVLLLRMHVAVNHERKRGVSALGTRTVPTLGKIYLLLWLCSLKVSIYLFYEVLAGDITCATCRNIHGSKYFSKESCDTESPHFPPPIMNLKLSFAWKLFVRRCISKKDITYNRLWHRTLEVCRISGKFLQHEVYMKYCLLCKNMLEYF